MGNRHVLLPDSIFGHAVKLVIAMALEDELHRHQQGLREARDA